MSARKKAKSEAPALPTIEILQFNMQAIVTYRDREGKATAVNNFDLSVMQSQFGLTLDHIANEVLMNIKERQKQEAAEARKNLTKSPPAPEAVPA